MADVVKYVGLSDVRRIRKEAWEAAGVKGQDTVVWEKRNGFSVPVEQLTDNALEILKQDKRFVLPKSEQEMEAETAADAETEDSDALPTGERTPSGATTTETSNQPSSTRGSRSGGKGGASS